ncbi:MAG: serine hydrolase domain-containing protein [Bacteroidota bacterium]
MKKLLSFFLSLMLIYTVWAQTPSSQHSPSLSYDQPEKVGMSQVRLDRIDSMCEKAIAEGEVPAIVALVARKGKIIYHKAFGEANVQTGEKMGREAIFRIASQTKAITSTAVMMLWEEGLFRLDDPISKYIPEFKNPKVLVDFTYADTSYRTRPADKEITIRHLLTHTSGIGYGFIDGDERMKMIYQQAEIVGAFEVREYTIKENVKKLAKLPLHHDPGEKYTYSMGLDVLGYFIEIMSGMTFEEFLDKRLFTPLGMNDTFFYLPKKKEERLVIVQEPEEGRWAKYTGNGYDADYPIKGAKVFFSGGAGLSSTAIDYANFLQMYLNGGELNGIRILSRTTVKTIMANQIGDIWQGDRHLGLAFGVLTEKGVSSGGLGSIGTFNWGGYFNTQYFADPEEQLIGILMKQTRGQWKDQTAWKFRLLANQAIDD